MLCSEARRRNRDDEETTLLDMVRITNQCLDQSQWALLRCTRPAAMIRTQAILVALVGFSGALRTMPGPFGSGLCGELSL